MTSLLEGIFCKTPLKDAAYFKQKYTDETVATMSANEANKKLNLDNITLDRQLGELQLAVQQTDSKNLKTITDMQQTIRVQAAQIVSLEDIAKNEASDNFKLLSTEAQNIALSYYEKYPNAEITYFGRCLPNKPALTYAYNIKNEAQAGIGCPEFMEVVKNANAFVLDIMKELNCSAHRACDISISRIKTYTASYYKYTDDLTSTGMNEFHGFALETHYSLVKYKLGRDCNWHADYQYVLWRSAGVPKELLRINAGIIQSNPAVAHQTNAYLASDLKWHHVNSTSPYQNAEILDLPLVGDKDDSIGIKTYYFSFNEEISSSDFAEPGTSATPDHEKFSKYKIRRVD